MGRGEEGGREELNYMLEKGKIIYLIKQTRKKVLRLKFVGFCYGKKSLLVVENHE